MKLGLIGNYGATNVGDDAILSSVLSQLKAHEVVIFSSSPEAWKGDDKTRSVPLFPLGFRSFFKRGLKASREALCSVDAVILGGGGLFQDDRLYAVFLWAWQIFWVKRMKKPLYIYATGVGPLRTRWGNFLTRWAYQQADFITVRDHSSAELLVAIGIKKPIEVAADPVFLHAAHDQDHEEVQVSSDRKGVRPGLIFVSIRPWLHYNPILVSCFKSFLARLQSQREVELVFVCMQSIEEDDLALIQPVMDELGGELFIPDSFSQLLERMHEAEFAVGMRYHFMIAAILTATPLLPISYSLKTTHLFDESPLTSHLIPVEGLSDKVMIEKFKTLSVSYNNVVIYEKSLAKLLSEKAAKNVEHLKNFLKTVDR